MSSETDHPRQRTVAELLAEHGGGDVAATGRRRRRRETDESEAPGQVVPLLPDPVVTSARVRPAPRDPVPPARAVPDELRERRTPTARTAAPPRRTPPPEVPPRSAPAAPPATAPPVAEPTARTAAPARQQPTPPVAEPGPPARENPTDVMPRFRDDTTPDATVRGDTARDGSSGQDTGQDEDLFTHPIPRQSTSSPGDVESAADADRGGPSTVIGAAPVGAEEWHRARTADAVADGTTTDGGPPLPAGPVDADEEPAGLGARRPAVDLEKHGDEPPPPRERRLGRGAAAAATPTWAGVLVQWIAGALGGAVLWVLFRFLWRNLPVVALASAVLVTVGLVVIVRALLHNDDRRTTVFAVLVGLLLTVSPAILVLLGR